MTLNSVARGVTISETDIASILTVCLRHRMVNMKTQRFRLVVLMLLSHSPRGSVPLSNEISSASEGLSPHRSSHIRVTTDASMQLAVGEADSGFGTESMSDLCEQAYDGINLGFHENGKPKLSFLPSSTLAYTSYMLLDIRYVLQTCYAYPEMYSLYCVKPTEGPWTFKAVAV